MKEKREGGIEAPTRHAIDWQSPDFYDRDKLNAELERVFDVCHGCRRCVSLCDSFPTCLTLSTSRKPWKSTVSTRRITRKSPTNVTCATCAT